MFSVPSWYFLWRAPKTVSSLIYSLLLFSLLLIQARKLWLIRSQWGGYVFMLEVGGVLGFKTVNFLADSYRGNWIYLHLLVTFVHAANLGLTIKYSSLSLSSISPFPSASTSTSTSTLTQASSPTLLPKKPKSKWRWLWITHYLFGLVVLGNCWRFGGMDWKVALLVNFGTLGAMERTFRENDYVWYAFFFGLPSILEMCTRILMDLFLLVSAVVISVYLWIHG